MAYQNDGDDEQNRMQVQFLSYSQTGDFGVRSKLLNFGYHAHFKDFYTKLCVCSHKLKIKKHIEQNFYSVAGVIPQGWDFGVLEVKKNFSMGICDGAPSTARSSLFCAYMVPYAPLPLI